MSTLPESSAETLPPTPPSTAGSVRESAEEPEIVTAHEEETPTVSHALAQESVSSPPHEREPDDPIGAAQRDHEDIEVKNLGWNEEARNVPRPVVGGLKNEELWTLLRRFNKQVFHVKQIEEPPLATLDMNIADEDEFSPDKLRAQLERFYMVVVVSLFSFWKHIVRLRSWKETNRTGVFLAVYLAAWLLDLVVPTITLFLMVIIASPPAREYCFPPAPPALIDSKTGGVQKPAAGVLASEDSVTGAPEKHKGEAVEQEAHSFVNSIATVVVSTAAGKDPHSDPHQDPEADDAAPDPTALTQDIANARAKAGGNNPSTAHDKTKVPISNAVWDKTRPLMHMLGDLVDTWERFGNALNPVAPFPRRRPRLFLASVLLPVLIGSYLTTSYMVMKGLGFGAGFGFFGDPIITRALSFINRTYPKWEKYVELRNTLLRGIPTNAQLTVTLLRIGEVNKAPIPPPPSSDQPPPLEPHVGAGEGLDHLEGATDEEIKDAVAADPTAQAAHAEETAAKPKKSHRIIGLLKGTTRGGVSTALAADKAKARAGASHARNRLGVVKPFLAEYPPTGPVSFPARYKGQKGHCYITATATTPALSWTSNIDDVHPAWTVTIADIEGLRKVGGLGWKSKIVVGWAMGREIVDGLVISSKGGKDRHVTAVSMRDELFNRLISMGSQMWEMH